MRFRGTATAVAIVMATVTGAAACGGSSGSASSTKGGANSPAGLLRSAKATIDTTQALHFGLSTQGAKGTIALLGGQGDLARPDKLKGTFQATFEGFPVTVPVAAGNGQFLAKLPPSSSYAPFDPSSIGLANPAKLLSPTGGLSGILTDVTNPSSDGQTRLLGHVVELVKGTVPGKDLTVLPDQDPSQPVTIEADIDTDNHQLRQIALTGPIGTTGRATYTVTLSNYGEHVDLALPST